LGGFGGFGQGGFGGLGPGGFGSGGLGGFGPGGFGSQGFGGLGGGGFGFGGFGGFGSRGVGSFDFGAPGGPFGYGSSPGAGPGLSSDWQGDTAIVAGKATQVIGTIVAGWGGLLAYAGSGLAPETGGASLGLAAQGAGLMVIGGLAVGLGAVVEKKGDAHNAAQAQAQAGQPQVPVVVEKKGKVINVPPVVIDDEEEPVDGGEIDDEEEPVDGGEIDDPDPNKQPRSDDEYPPPDDWGGGGGGPTMMWDDDEGHGDPTMMWDDDRGGGDPTMMWDDNSEGGGNPVFSPTLVSARALAGPGLGSALQRVGRATYRA
jgi:hypothetical protein